MQPDVICFDLDSITTVSYYLSRGRSVDLQLVYHGDNCGSVSALFPNLLTDESGDGIIGFSLSTTSVDTRALSTCPTVDRYLPLSRQRARHPRRTLSLSLMPSMKPTSVPSLVPTISALTRQDKNVASFPTVGGGDGRGAGAEGENMSGIILLLVWAVIDALFARHQAV